ncbi:bifunctional lysylphosphatidylglycerol flippase/synthetase MprF [Oxalobacteraceae bacterium CAVE-383]|nr:bifunctional lysylphosphatidylglycerol flippase/synthetase MprF [Oxalobacteraceae bacterium CAVE-383]
MSSQLADQSLAAAPAAPPPHPLTEWLLAAKPWLIGAGLLLIGAMVFDALHHVLRDVHYKDILHTIRHLPKPSLAMALLCTGLSYLALTGYDASSLRYVGAKVKGSTVAMTSFIAYALGNTIGLGVLTGGTVRMRLFTAAGVDAGKVAQAIAFNAGAFGLGMTAFGAAGLLWGAADVAGMLHIHPLLLRILSGATLLGIAGLVILCMRRRSVLLLGRWTLQLPDGWLAIRQLLISAADLGAAAAALWFLLPSNGVPLPTFAAFYALAMALGVISHVPGGLGVFEAVIMVAWGPHAPAGEIAGALVMYRVIYFLLPLLIAAILLAALEIRSSALATLAPISRAAVRLSPGIMTALVLVAGIMLLVSGVTPATHSAERLLRTTVPLFAVEMSHLIGSVAGLAMLFVARGLLHKLDAAWWAALVLTVLAALLALPKGIAVSELMVLSLLTLLLLSSRKQFNRRSSLFSQTFEAGWLLAVASVIAGCAGILFFVYQDVKYADLMWWQFAFDDYAPRAMRTLLVVAILGLAVGLRQLLRKPDIKAVKPTAQEMARAQQVVQAQPAAEACLALMGDKSLLFSASGKSFIMYAKHGRSWIALSDPVGAQQEWPELIWRFIETADAHGGRAAFYKVRPQTLPLYLDAGLRAYKLGEEAYVNLHDFSLQGPRRANLRHGVKRGEREGLAFDVIPPPRIPEILAEIRAISDAWLQSQNTREKSFSMGAFKEPYVLQQSIAVVRKDDRIVAFATLMAPQVLRIEAAIDLMRQQRDAPPGTMDFLFANMMLYCQAQGYQRFGLGMAPMSGMEQHQLASRWHRFGRMMFQHGERFYNFRGLRSFKDKFDPEWEARYMIAEGGLAPVFTFSDIAALINGGLKGAISK